MSSPEEPARVDLVTALRRGWRWIVVLTLAGALLLAGAQLLRPEVYTSSTDVLWEADGGQVLPALPVAEDGDAERQLSTQARLVVGDLVMEAAADDADVDVDDLRDATEVEVQESSNVIAISVTAGTAEEAQTAAAAVADAFVIGNRERGIAALVSQADALRPRIDDLRRELDLIAAQESEILDTPGGVLDPTTGARRDALVEQLAAATDREDELRTSAGLYTGQASVISGATLPLAPSSTSLPVSAALGAALGLTVGALLAVALATRREGRAARSASAPTAAGQVSGNRGTGSTAKPRAPQDRRSA